MAGMFSWLARGNAQPQVKNHSVSNAFMIAPGQPV